MSPSLTIIASLVAASSVLAQSCTPGFTAQAGAPYDIKSNINDSFVWLFNGASRGTPSAVHLTPVPTKNSAWYINAADSESGNWTISINESNPPVTCVLAPSNSEGDVLKLLTTGSCSDSTDADVSITCQTCGNDGSSGTACTIFVPGHDECVNVPGDSDGNPDIRTAECTGSPQQLWDIVPFSSE